MLAQYCGYARRVIGFAFLAIEAEQSNKKVAFNSIPQSCVHDTLQMITLTQIVLELKILGI